MSAVAAAVSAAISASLLPRIPSCSSCPSWWEALSGFSDRSLTVLVAVATVAGNLLDLEFVEKGAKVYVKV